MSVDTLSRKIKIFSNIIQLSWRTLSPRRESQRPSSNNLELSLLYIYEMRNVNIILWVDEVRSYRITQSQKTRSTFLLLNNKNKSSRSQSEARRWRKTRTNRIRFSSVYLTPSHPTTETMRTGTRTKREDDVKTRSDIDDGD